MMDNRNKEENLLDETMGTQKEQEKDLTVDTVEDRKEASDEEICSEEVKLLEVPGEEATQEGESDEVEETVPKIKLSQKVKKSFQNRKFRSGAYTAAVSVVVIAIVLVVNIFISRFDWKLDLSSNRIFTLTDATKDFVKGINDDITIYYLVKAGDEYDYYVNLAERYDALSDHITLEYKDPVLYPKFAQTYTDSAVTENSVIVVNNTNGRSKYIDSTEMQETSMDYSTYQTYTTGIDFEGQVTAALQYVTSDECPVFYQVTGHSEQEAGASFSSLISKQNIELKTFTTTKVESVPEDCDGLIIYAPRTDYTEQEVNMIKDYLVNGGKAMIIADYFTNDCKNFVSLLNYYGVEIVDGYIMEADYDHMAYQFAPYIIPEVNSSIDALSNFSSTGSFVVSPYSVGIRTLEAVRSTVTIEDFLTTSDNSFSKADIESKTMSKEDGDIDGPFSVGVAISETYNEVETNLIVLGGPMIPDESTISSPSYANYDLMSSLVSSMSDSEVQALSIPTKSLQSSYLTLTSSQQNFWLYTAFIIIPVIVLITGGVVVIRRRKK